MTKKFIAQLGSNNRINVFDLNTGSLHRIISVDGQLVTPPVVVENDLTVTVNIGNSQVTKVYDVASGSLKHTFAQS